MLAPLIVMEVAVLTMVDWQPLVVALAAFLGALTTAVPTVILLLVHRSDIRANGAGIARVEQQTNGELLVLRAENVRLKTLLDDAAVGVVLKPPPAHP